ncbi:hypothetical protein ACWF62_10840 [Rhodococcus sp. NPDC054953]
MPDGDAAHVLDRWHPQPPGPVVAVVGPPGSGVSALAVRLRAVLPDADVVDGHDRVAAVTVFVVAAAAPIGRDDLDLLRAVAGRGSAVLVALTKVDAHRDWAVVRERDTVLLADHAPGVEPAPILPVSARTGRGLPGLRDAVVAALARVDPGRGRRAALERARSVVRGTADDLRRDDDTPRLRARRAELIAGRDEPRAQASAALRRLTALARVDLAHQVGERVRGTATALRSPLDRADRPGLAGFAHRVRAEVAALTVELDAATTTVLTELGAQVLGTAHPAPGPHRPPPTVADPEPRHRGVEDRMVVVVGASAGVGLGRLVASPLSGIAALDLIVAPLSLLIGGVAAWWLTRMRGLAADRAHLRQWLAETMAQVRSGLEQRSLTRLVEAEATLIEAIGAAHRVRVAATEPVLIAVDRALRESATRAAGRLSAIERDLADLDRALAEPEAVRARPIGQ